MADGKTYQEVLEMLDQYAQDKGLTISDMFGSTEAGKAALAVTGENADKFNNNLSAMNTDSDVVGEAYDKVADTTAEKFNKLVNTLKNSGIEVFDSIKDKIGELFSDENLEKVQRLIDPIKGLVENVLPPVMDILLDLIDPVSELVEQLLPVIETLLNSCADIISELAEPLTDVINEVLPVLADILDALLPPLMDIIKSLLPPLVKVLETLAKPLLELIEKLLPPIVQLLGTISPLIEALSPIITFLAEVLGGVLGEAIEAVMPLIDFLSDTITFLLDTLTNLINFIVGVFAGDWEKAWTAIVDQFKNVFEMIPKIAEDVVNAAIGLINRIIDKINDFTGVLGIEIDKIDNVDFTPDDESSSGDSDMGGGGSGGKRDGSAPGYAFGSDFIPEDDFPAKLHRGEAVLSAGDAEVFRALGGKGSLERMAAEPMGGGASEEMAAALGRLAESGGTTNNITQNNYSPKELSPYDTKRYLEQVAQQLSERK